MGGGESLILLFFCKELSAEEDDDGSANNLRQIGQCTIADIGIFRQEFQSVSVDRSRNLDDLQVEIEISPLEFISNEYIY